MTIIDKIASAVTGKLDPLSAETVRSRITAARTALARAVTDHASIAYRAEQGDPAAAAAKGDALSKVAGCKARLSDLEAALGVAEAADTQKARDKSNAVADAQDRESRAAFTKLAEAAKEHEASVAASDVTWMKLVRAEDDARVQSALNPRVRPDLLLHNLGDLVKTEIARAGDLTAPGARRAALSFQQRSEITPLSKHFGDVAKFVSDDLRTAKSARSA